jgi:hypothetical protein
VPSATLIVMTTRDPPQRSHKSTVAPSSMAFEERGPDRPRAARRPAPSATRIGR